MAENSKNQNEQRPQKVEESIRKPVQDSIEKFFLKKPTMLADQLDALVVTNELPPSPPPKNDNEK